MEPGSARGAAGLSVPSMNERSEMEPGPSPHRLAARSTLSSAALALAVVALGCDGLGGASFVPDPARPRPELAGGESPSRAVTSASAPEHVTAVRLADMLAPYPHGRWRLAARAEVARARVWASHILVRHRDVGLGGVVFGPLERATRRPERTRADARALAQRIAEEARSAPERFAALAREHSEDLVTKTTNGSLGAVSGASLLAFPQVLDAFAALRSGEVSEAVETDYGFHVFRLRPPPPERSLSAAHIVIGYDEATWLEAHLARGPVPRRSRDAALSIASALYERALAAPREFAALAVESSEHMDALHGGDFGEWSTAAPGAYGRELELLLELPVYGVAPPIDTLFGIEIVQRTPDRPRERFAVQMIRLPFDPSAAPSTPSSRSSVLALATGLAEQLSLAPERFSALQAQYCCAAETLQWTERQEASWVAYAAERLPLGGISPRPIEFASTYVIAKRVEPAASPRALPTVDVPLPAPEEVDLDLVASSSGREALQAQLDRVAREVERALALAPPRAAELRRAMELPRERFDDGGGAERRAAHRELLGRVRSLLGDEGFGRYLEISRAHFLAWRLAQPL